MLSQRMAALHGDWGMKATFLGVLTALAALALLGAFVIIGSSTGWAQEPPPSVPPTAVPNVCMACHGP